MLRDETGNLTQTAIDFEKEIDKITTELIQKGRSYGFSFEEIFYEISTCTDMQILRLRREERRNAEKNS